VFKSRNTKEATDLAYVKKIRNENKTSKRRRNLQEENHLLKLIIDQTVVLYCS
jgi:hypothetical protein